MPLVTVCLTQTGRPQRGQLLTETTLSQKVHLGILKRIIKEIMK